MNYMKNYIALGLAAFIFLGCVEKGADTSRTEDSSKELPDGLEFLASREAFEPQVTILRDDTLVLTWRERGEAGSNIFASVKASDGGFGSPVRVNDEIDTVESYAHDGMRAAIAVGEDATIALAWADSRAQIRAAISTDGGTSFAASTRLDQAVEPAYRAYPAISFDSSGNLHAIWIDARYAKPGAEEPADLFYAELSRGQVAEVNLTADQEPSICGCCRTFIRADNDSLTMAFRNTTAEGYRDPATINGTRAGGFSQPLSAGEPLWELSGCPMAGPVLAGNEILWHDGSTGKKLTMLASLDERETQRLFDDEEIAGWIGRRPPRAISTVDGLSSVLLVPGEPASRLIARGPDQWTVVADDMPDWASNATYSEGMLTLVGAPSGKFRYTTRHVNDAKQSFFEVDK